MMTVCAKVGSCVSRSVLQRLTFGTWRGFCAISVVEVVQLAKASESVAANVSRAIPNVVKEFPLKPAPIMAQLTEESRRILMLG